MSTLSRSEIRTLVDKILGMASSPHVVLVSKEDSENLLTGIVTLLAEVDRQEKQLDALGGPMVYSNVIECLKILNPLDKPGQPNTLWALTERAMSRIQTLELQVDKLNEGNRIADRLIDMDENHPAITLPDWAKQRKRLLRDKNEKFRSALDLIHDSSSCKNEPNCRGSEDFCHYHITESALE